MSEGEPASSAVTAPAAAAATTPSQWSYRIPKAHIYPSSLGAINDRIAALGPLAQLADAGTPAYTSASCSPLYLRVEVDEEKTSALLGPRQCYGPCTPPLTEQEAAGIVAKTAQALSCLHARGVVHGHLHCGVVERHLESTARVVLRESELPVSALVPASTLGVSARRCAAPEIHRGSPYGSAADVWGLAVLLLQLLSDPAKVLTTEDLIDSDVLSPFVSLLSPQATSFVLPCLKGDPAARPLMESVLRHPLLASALQREGHEAATESRGREFESAKASTESSEGSDADESSSESV